MADWLLSKKKISIERNKPDLNRMFDAGLPGSIGRPVGVQRIVNSKSRTGPLPPPEKFIAGHLIVEHTGHSHDYFNNQLGKISIKIDANFKWDDSLHFWTFTIKNYTTNEVYHSQTNISNFLQEFAFDFSKTPSNSEIKFTDIIIEAAIYVHYNTFTSIAQLNSNIMSTTIYVLSDQYKLNKQLFYSNVLSAYNFPSYGNLTDPFYAISQPTGKKINIGIIDDGIINRHRDLHNVYNSIDWPYITVQFHGGKLPYDEPFHYESITNNGNIQNINAGGYTLNSNTAQKVIEAVTWTNQDGAWFNSATMSNIGDNTVMLFGGVDIGHYNFRNFENNHFNKNLWKLDYIQGGETTWMRYDNKELANNCILPDSLTEGVDSVYVDGKFHIFGGSHSLSHMILNKSLAFTNQFFQFNTEKKTWLQKDPSIEPPLDIEEKSNVPPDTRAYHKNVPLFDISINDAKHFMLFGGITLKEGDFYPTVEDNSTWIFDSTKNSWLHLPVHKSDPDGRYLHNIAPIGNNRVVMIGGCAPTTCEFNECHLNSENNLIDVSVTYNSLSNKKNFWIKPNESLSKKSMGNVATCGTNGTLLLSHYDASSMKITKLTLKDSLTMDLKKGTHVIRQINDTIMYFTYTNTLDASGFKTFGDSNPDKIVTIELIFDAINGSKVIYVEQTHEIVKFPGISSDPSSNIFNLFAVSGEIVTDLGQIDFMDDINKDKDDGVLEYAGGDTVGYYWHDISGFHGSSPQSHFAPIESHLNSISMWPTYPGRDHNNSVAKFYVGGDDDYLHYVDISNISKIMDPSNTEIEGIVKDISPFKQPCYLVQLDLSRSFVRFHDQVHDLSTNLIGYVKYSSNESKRVYLEVFNGVELSGNQNIKIKTEEYSIHIIEFQPGGQFQQGSYNASNFNLVSDYKYGGDDKTSKQNNKYGGKKNYIGNVCTFKRYYGFTNYIDNAVVSYPVEGNGKYIFCTGAGKSLYRSDDYGATWIQLLHWGIDGGWGDPLQDPQGLGGKYRHADQFIRSIDVFGTYDSSGLTSDTSDNWLNTNINYFNNPVWVVGSHGLLGQGDNFGNGPWTWINPRALDCTTIYFTKRNNAWSGSPVYDNDSTSTLYKSSQVPIFNIDAIEISQDEQNSLHFNPQQVISTDNVIIRIRDFKLILDSSGFILPNVTDNSWNIMPSKDGIALGFCNAGGGVQQSDGNGLVKCAEYQPWLDSTDFFTTLWSPNKDSSFINHSFYFTSTDQNHINNHQEIQKRTFPNDSLGGDLMSIDDNGMPFDVFNSEHAGEIWTVGGNWLPKEPEAFAMTLTSQDIVRDEGNFADENGAQTWIFQYDPLFAHMSYWMNISIPIVKQKLIFNQPWYDTNNNVNTIHPWVETGGLLDVINYGSNPPDYHTKYLIHQPDTGARGYIYDSSQNGNTNTILIEMIKGYIDIQSENNKVYLRNFYISDTYPDGKWGDIPYFLDFSNNEYNPTAGLEDSIYPFTPPDTSLIVENPTGIAPYASYFENNTFTYYNNGRTLDTSSNYSGISDNIDVYQQSHQALLQDLSTFSCKTNFSNGSMSYLQNNTAMMYGGVKAIFPERDPQRVQIINDRYFLFHYPNTVKTLSGEDLNIDSIDQLKSLWPVYSQYDFNNDNIKQLNPATHLNIAPVIKDLSNINIAVNGSTLSTLNDSLFPTWYIYRSGTFETFIFNYNINNHGRSSTWTTLMNNDNLINRGPSDVSTNHLYNLTEDPPPVDYSSNILKPGNGAYQNCGYRFGHQMSYLTTNKSLLWGGLSYDMSKERNGFIIEPGFHEGGVYPEPFKYTPPINSYYLNVANPRPYYDYLVDNFGEKHGVYLTDQRLGWTTDTWVFNYKGHDGNGTITDSYWENLHINRPGYSVEPIDNNFSGNAASHGTSVSSIINSNKKTGYNITQRLKFIDTDFNTDITSEKGIQGIAFDSNIYIFRAWDNLGHWPSSTAGIDWREILYNENMSYFTHNLINNNIKICNNSWGFLTFSTGFKYRGWFVNQLETDDFDYNIIYQNYVLQSQAGIVNICAAGNNSDSESNLLAGTPLYIPECMRHWINVVGLEVTDDEIVQETFYTNRAGLSWAWTISAIAGSSTTDGGVISASNQKGMEDHDDLDNMPGYKKVQGTSMATPLVSGALSIIMNRFPNLTSSQCVDRLFQTAAGGIGSDISGRITTDFTPSNPIFSRYYKGHLCDPAKDTSDNNLVLSADPNSTETLYNIYDISAVFGWGFLDLSAACAPMDEQGFQDLLLFGAERERLILTVIKDTFGVTTGIKDILSLSDELEGSIRLIYPTPDTAPIDGLGRRGRRIRLNGRRRRKRGGRGVAVRKILHVKKKFTNPVRRKHVPMGKVRIHNKPRIGLVRGLANKKIKRYRKKKVRRGRQYSDSLLKDNINLIGYSNMNIPIYEFTYKYNYSPEQKYRGTIAQDLLDMNMLHVVHKELSGYYSVNYDLIDIDFEII